VEILGYSFMQRAIVASILIGTVTAVIGVYVVLRGLAFIGAGIAHASFGGVALGFLLGVDPVLSAVAFCLATAWGIAWASARAQIREDTAIGIFFAATMALGILLIGLMRQYNVDLFGYLFGSVLSVTREDLWLSGLLGVGVLAVVALFFKEFLFITFDPEMAQVSGIPARWMYLLLLSIMALTVVVSIKVVGIILVSAMIVVPAASAYQLTEDFRTMMAVAVLIGNASAIGGLLSALLSPRRWAGRNR
jgi:ABC-type Mn2+/Zn2+ transport system permease subunit